jgi:GDPmannose 4,6-dehydratase
MWLMMQQEKSGDYIISTGENHSIEDFLNIAFSHAGISDWKKYVKIDKEFYRPSEVHLLMGDYSKARKKLGWKPKVGFQDLVRMMVDADMRLCGLKSSIGVID